MAPSLLQTLLRQPSQSYSSRTSPSPSLRDVSLYSSSGSASRPRSRTSSLRSSQSRESATPSGDWSNGQWDWSQYGGRAGLTGGPASIHPSEVASALGVPGEGRRRGSRSNSQTSDSRRAFSDDGAGDTGSLRSHRSSKSLTSVKSSTKHRGAASSSQEQLGNGASWSQRQQPLPTGAPSSRKTSRSYSSTSVNETSRRYSTLSPSPSLASSSRRASDSPSPSSEAPSLTSSLSSAPSSPPITPVHATIPPLFPDPVSASAPAKRPKKRREVVDLSEHHYQRDELERVDEAAETEGGMMALQEEAIEHGARSAEGRPANSALVSSQTMDVLDKFAAPEPTLLDPSPKKARQYYSVDEFFALAAPPIAFPSVDSSPSSAVGTEEAEPVKTTVLNDSVEPLADGATEDESGAAHVPRIRLTRTESDQAAAGVDGDIEVSVASDEEEDASLPTSSSSPTVTRKRSKRRSVTSMPSAEPSTTFEVVASSSATSPSRARSPAPLAAPAQLTSSNLATASSPSSASTVIASAAAAADTPAWLSRIRALGEPIENASLVQLQPTGSKRNSTPEPHWTVRQYEQQQREQQQQQQAPPRRPSSVGNLRRPKSVMPPMPEERDEEVAAYQMEQELRRSASLSAGAAGGGVGSRSSSPGVEGSLRSSPSEQQQRRSITPSPSSSPSRRRTQSEFTPPSPSLSSSFAHPPPIIAPHSGPIASSSSHFIIPPPPAPTPFVIPTAASEGFIRPRASSVISDTPSAFSTSGYSTMSVPTGAFHRPPKNSARALVSNRNSMVASSTTTSTTPKPRHKDNPNLMYTLSISAAALARPSQSNSGLGIFKRAAAEPPLSSTRAASSPSSRTFDPVRDLTFSALSPLPNAKKVRSEEVLVEVFCAGVERIDVERTRELAGVREGFGWVPGRAFIGKVGEVGEAVSRLKRGDLVWGFTALKKSSALAEFVVVHRDRVALAPINAGLSVESLTALPSAAACALQVMEPICRELSRGSKILILNAHQGVGFLCLQLAPYLRPTKDLYVVAHCPPSAIFDQQEATDLLKQAGASHVVRDESLATLNACHEAEFDVVVDCIGGRRIYDASRRVLHHSGAFISTVGSSLPSSTSAATPNAPPISSWKSSLRSLRRTFIKKDKKLLSVLLITPETVEERGEAPREVLDRAAGAVGKGALRPRALREDQVVRFEEGRRLFEGEGDGGVVRVKEV